MKVGTDAVLLGAWCDVNNKSNALDIGTGTGVIALMIAQRNPNIQVTAIDIDAESVLQAKENAESSPFNERIKICNTDFTTFTSNEKFDLIVSNPPYYEEQVFCPDEKRNNARHTSSLDFSILVKQASEFLNHKGIFAVIIPTQAIQSFISLCVENKLYLLRRTDIFTAPKKQPKRVLLEFTDNVAESKFTKLYMRDENNSLSNDYISLTKDFYL